MVAIQMPNITRISKSPFSAKEYMSGFWRWQASLGYMGMYNYKRK